MNKMNTIKRTNRSIPKHFEAVNLHHQPVGGAGVRRKKSLAETKVSGQMFLRKININRHDVFETLLIICLSFTYPNFP